MKKRLYVNLDEDVYQLVEQQAQAENKSKAEVVNEILRRHFESLQLLVPEAWVTLRDLLRRRVRQLEHDVSRLERELETAHRELESARKQLEQVEALILGREREKEWRPYLDELRRITRQCSSPEEAWEKTAEVRAKLAELGYEVTKEMVELLWTSL